MVLRESWHRCLALPGAKVARHACTAGPGIAVTILRTCAGSANDQDLLRHGCTALGPWGDFSETCGISTDSVRVNENLIVFFVFRWTSGDCVIYFFV